ncbi:hypothetical protein RND71_039673 [Anisodus tanguticus]|uniref:Uncharacterized protein n=1 Tax=Anisodus tanguticus TaxID=243964 RepID=A0AAE1QZL3_9SOLA|nr:hypothetical protein RND71_039673 [Anisodus tanguticus]
MRVSEVQFVSNFIIPRARKILDEWNDIDTMDIGDSQAGGTPEYHTWLREDRGNTDLSPESEQGFEDIVTTIWSATVTTAYSHSAPAQNLQPQLPQNKGSNMCLCRAQFPPNAAVITVVTPNFRLDSYQVEIVSNNTNHSKIDPNKGPTGPPTNGPNRGFDDSKQCLGSLPGEANSYRPYSSLKKQRTHQLINILSLIC